MKDEQRNLFDSKPGGSKLLNGKSLFGDSREVRIEYQGEVYRLRITRNEKLILTK